MAHKQGDELANRTGYRKQKTRAEVPEYIRVRLPNSREKEMFGVAEQLLGASRIKVMGTDAKSRVSRIPGKMKKNELIHAIQGAEGNTQCFGWSNGQCSNLDCCFMKDCLKTRL